MTATARVPGGESQSCRPAKGVTDRTLTRPARRLTASAGEGPVGEVSLSERCGPYGGAVSGGPISLAIGKVLTSVLRNIQRGHATVWSPAHGSTPRVGCAGQERSGRVYPPMMPAPSARAMVAATLASIPVDDDFCCCREALIGDPLRRRSGAVGGLRFVRGLVLAVVLVVLAVVLVVLVVPPAAAGRGRGAGWPVVVDALVGVVVGGGAASAPAGAAGDTRGALVGVTRAGSSAGAALGGLVGVVAGESAVMVKESSKVVGTEGTNWAERRVAVTEYFTKPLPGLILAPISVSK